MKYIIISLALLLAPTTAFAKQAPYHIIGIPAYFLFQTTVHESSHALVAEIAGAHITNFEPYPHTVDGNFYFGRTVYKHNLPNSTHAALLAAPLVTDIIMFTATDMLIPYIHNNTVATIIWIMGMIAPFIDYLCSINGWSAYNDTSQWTAMTNTPRWAITVAGDAFAFLGAWRIIDRYKLLH